MMSEENILQEKQYDVMFLYGREKAYEWAKHTSNILESSFNMKCCLAERDFIQGFDLIPGVKLPFVDHIVSYMQTSKTLVAVLTREGFDGPLFMYILKYALYLNVSLALKLIPVMIEDCEVPFMLIHLTYLDVTKENDWIEKLVLSIQSHKDLAANAFLEELNEGIDLLRDLRLNDASEFSLLLKRGTYRSYYNRIYLAGACKVGKSTLASLLIGEDISRIWISTDGLRIYFGRNGIDLRKRIMVPLPEDLKSMNVLCGVLRGQPQIDQSKPQVEHDRYCDDGNHLLTSKADKDTAKQVVSKTATDNSEKNIIRIPLEKDQFDEKHSGIHQSVLTEIKKGVYKVQVAPSDLVDFGGQKAYDMTHQLFIQHKGIFVLMVDGRKHLDEILTEYPQNDMTNKKIIFHWVNSILTYCVDDDDDIVPKIVFAATHVDELTLEEKHSRKLELIRELMLMFGHHEKAHRIVLNEVFFINATDNNDAGVKLLQQKLVDIAMKQKSWGQKSLMAWVPLELQIDEKRSNGAYVISLDELQTINKANDDLSLTDTQLKNFLKSQHSMGRIMYYDVRGLDNFIILQPIALADLLRSFITDKMFWPTEPELLLILETTTTSGQITKFDLFKLWSQKKFHHYMETEDIKEFIVHVLVYLDILVEPKRHGTTQQKTTDMFLVPCMVKKSHPAKIFSLESEIQKSIYLSYKLLKLAIPNALTFKLIGAILNIWPLKKINGELCLFDRAAIFDIDKNTDLYLFFKDNSMNIRLTNNRSKSFLSPDIASITQECLTSTMTKVLRFYLESFGNTKPTLNYSRLFEIEVGEACGEQICYVALSNIKEKTSWTCDCQKKHQTKFALYWAHDKTQTTCSQDCPGLDTEGLALEPEDKHLIRLARKIGKDFEEFILYLGLHKIEWDGTEKDQVDWLTRKFTGLCEWKKQKQAMLCNPTFKDLSTALTKIDPSDHLLCQVFRERTEVLALENTRLSETPADDVLYQLSKHLGHHTLHLGVELGLDLPTIEETIFRLRKDMFGQTYDILQKWKTTATNTTVRSLMIALQHVDPRGLSFLKGCYD